MLLLSPCSLLLDPCSLQELVQEVGQAVAPHANEQCGVGESQPQESPGPDEAGGQFLRQLEPGQQQPGLAGGAVRYEQDQPAEEFLPEDQSPDPLEGVPVRQQGSPDLYAISCIYCTFLFALLVCFCSMNLLYE